MKRDLLNVLCYFIAFICFVIALVLNFTGIVNGVWYSAVEATGSLFIAIGCTLDYFRLRRLQHSERLK